MSFQSGNLPAVGTGALLPQITRNWLYQKACKIRGLFALPFRKQKAPFFQIHPRFSFLYPSVRCRILPTSGKENKMKKRNIRKTAAALTALALCAGVLTGCGGAASSTASSVAASSAASSEASGADADALAAQNVADLIDAIYVQQRTDDTDAQCEAAKAAWDALTDAQKELVEGEEASPDYFGLDTGDASLDDPRNADGIGEKEILVVSFGTSYNGSRVADIKGVEDAIAAAFPDWAVRRAFTAQIIINHVQARDGEFIDNMDQALERAVASGVKQLVVQPTHLMHGAEYDELMEAVAAYADQFETIMVAEPLLGEVGKDATVVNADKAAVAEAIVSAAVAEGGFESVQAAADNGTAFVFMGHGTAHVAKVTYSQMQTQMANLGYKNVFIGTVEGEPEETACENIIEAVAAAGYKNVVLRPLMVVAGDHANNDMAGDEEDSWKSMFLASGKFDSVDCQIAGLGSIEAVQNLYIAHTQAAIDGNGATVIVNSEEAAAVGQLADGVYTVDVTTDGGMFKLSEAVEGKGTLTVKDGQMTVHFTLSGKGFSQVFVGSAEDAQKEGAAVIDAVEDTLNFSDGTTDTANGFDVPVEELNEAFALAAMGKKSAKWYDHTLCVSNPVQQ